MPAPNIIKLSEPLELSPEKPLLHYKKEEFFKQIAKVLVEVGVIILQIRVFSFKKV